MLQFIVDLRGNQASRAQLQDNQMMGGSGCFPFCKVERGTERVKESKHCGNLTQKFNPSHSKSRFYSRILVGDHKNHHRENGGTLGMVPLIINPIYTLYSGYLDVSIG